MIEVKNELRDLQALVGGFIEVAPIDRSKNILLVCNEEGKLIGLPRNRYVPIEKNIDVICGNFFVCQYEGEEFVGLAEENIAFVKDII
jgi:hypothetical protein